jgi:hypothetical protein
MKIRISKPAPEPQPAPGAAGTADEECRCDFGVTPETERADGPCSFCGEAIDYAGDCACLGEQTGGSF